MMLFTVPGRMRLSRCVRRDYGHVGCTADVRAEVDAMCSGRLGGCRFAVSRLNPRQPCPGDLTPYLQIAYECVPGEYKTNETNTQTLFFYQSNEYSSFDFDLSYFHASSLSALFVK